MAQRTMSDLVKEYWDSKRKNSIKKLTVNGEDVLVFNVATGNMPNFRAHEYIRRLREDFRDKFLKGNRDVTSLWFSKPDNSSGSDVTKLNVKKGDILVFTVETGNMPKAKADQYLKSLKDKFDRRIVDGEPVQSMWIARPRDTEGTTVKKITDDDKELIFSEEKTKIKRKLTRKLKDVKLSKTAQEEIKAIIKDL